uniref:Low-density lipoprotein receptor-related protein 11 n=1 Tax=Lygus hesperus TaxID=30085 RepID=A0A0A9VV93_LYGHE
MRLRHHLGKILFLVCHTLTFAHREEGDQGSYVLKRTLHDFPSCRDSFDIQNDKIIRTQDSKAMGARYLNERDVASREECMQLCCSSDNCDVFVFEEMKVPGGCYLFECGPPEDFKCKFTRYKNYTSGFLNVNQQLHELESQIKYSQHERELAKLREPSVPTEPPSAHKTTVSPRTKEVPEQYAQEPPPSHQGNSKRGCKRNQFECHSTGECIAIYNACDGIPQCSDGSDESPELGCPALQTTIMAPIKHVHPTSSPVVIRHQQQEYIPEADMNGETVNANRELSAVPVRKQWPSSEEYGAKNQQSLGGVYQPKIPSTGGSQMSGLNVQDVPRSGYGREGEELVNYRGPDPSSSWGSSQYHHNQGSQIFTHKGEGLVVPQNSRFQQQPHSYMQPESSVRSGLQYNEPGQSDYSKYYVENPNYNRLYGVQGPNGWPSPPKPHNMNLPEQSIPQGLDEIPGGRSEVPQSGPYPDYYYEEMYKNKLQAQQQPYQAPAQTMYQQQNELVAPSKPIQSKMTAQPKESIKPEAHSVHNEAPTVQTTSTATADPKAEENKANEKEESSHHGHDHAKSAHRKLDQLHADVRLKESILNIEEDIQSTTPRGAVLSLTMGLCITGIMLILVGCRMRMVSKRMRRGGKGYAHDADFLVNGMYL